MLLENGIATGFIAGDAIAPPEYILWSMPYADFKNRIIVDGDCSSIILANYEAKGESIIDVNNPFESLLRVQFSSMADHGYVKLSTMTGNVYMVHEINSVNLVELDMPDGPPGMYLLEVHVKGRREIFDVVKFSSR